MISHTPAAIPIRAVPRLSAAPDYLAPPPMPDLIFTGYSGVPGLLETAAVVTVSAAAAWIGIRTAIAPKQSAYVQAAGWIGGIGSALLGLLYLGGKSGLAETLGIPVVRVSPE